MEKRIDIVNLRFSQSLIVGNLPARLRTEPLSAKQISEEHDIAKFGFWDTSNPSLSNYYPDLKIEELDPANDPDGFAYPVFRALSQVTVHKRRNPISFARPGVLKNSMNLLVGQTVYANHDMVTGNEAGAVLEVFWQNAYTTASGIKVPAGIMSRLKIDGRSNPRIVRGITMDPPSIHSVSVTVEFAWEKSHPNISDEDFWAKLGGYDEQGRMYERVVTEVLRYHEISLVPHGADPYAQRVDEKGHIVNPIYADKVYNCSDGENKTPQVYHFSYKDLAKLSEGNTEGDNLNNNIIEMNKHLLSLAALLGVMIPTDNSLTEDQLSEKITEAVKLLKPESDYEITLGEKDSEITRLKQELAEAKESNKSSLSPEDTAKITLADKATSELRAEAVRLHNVLTVNKPENSIVEMLNKASYEVLSVLVSQYKSQVDEKYPAKCAKCNSTEITRQSTKEPGEQGDNKDKKSVWDAQEEFAKKAKQESNKDFYSKQ